MLLLLLAPKGFELQQERAGTQKENTFSLLFSIPTQVGIVWQIYFHKLYSNNNNCYIGYLFSSQVK